MEPDDLPLIAQGYRISQALYAACALRLPDHLGRASQTADELAAVVGAHPDRLRRLMRALAAEAVFTEDEDGRFGPTTTSDCLTGDSEDRLMVLGWRVLPPVYAAFGRLVDAVKTGDVAFELAHDQPFYAYLDSHPSVGAAYEAAMDSTVGSFSELYDVYDFTRHRVVVDVGGGQGSFLICLLSRYAGLRGVLFDSPRVVAGAADRLANGGVADRVEVIGGDAFREVPGGGDLYLTCTVLRCFDDVDCLRILRAVRRAATPGVSILAFEQMIPDGVAQGPTAMLDLHTMTRTVDATEQRESTERFTPKRGSDWLTPSRPAGLSPDSSARRCRSCCARIDAPAELADKRLKATPP